MDLSKFSTEDLKALQAGDLSKVSTEALRLLQATSREARVKAQQEADRKEFDPTAGMGTGDRLLAGIGSGMTSAGRAVYGLAAPVLDAVAPRRNVTSLVTGQDNSRVAELQRARDEAERLDKPLLDTSAGTVGKVIGLAAPAAVAVPFTPATFAGAATAGGITGAALTEGGIGERAQGGALGALGGLVGQAAPIVIRTGKETLKGLAEPFTAAGRDRIAGRVIDRFATNRNALQGLTNTPTATGARQTLSEATRDPGLATLERAIGTTDPETAAALAARGQANNAARVAVLQDIAGDATKRGAAEGARKAAVSGLYADADAAVVPLDDTFKGLMQRPAFSAAVQQAQALAKNEGIADLFFRGSNGEPIAITGQGAHLIKKALDDAMDRGSSTYLGEAAERATGKTQQTFLGWLGKTVPEYDAAKQTFADMSKSINRMDVGQRLLDKTTAAVRDLGGNPKLQANAFARALNDEDALVKAATGMDRSLSDVMTPEQMAALGAVRNELETVANLGQAANGPGSQTAKMLASQNLLQRIAGPLGLPQSFAESVLARSLMRPVQFGMQAAEPRIQEAIARGLLDPAEALRMLAASRAADAVVPPNALQELARRSAPAAIGGLSAYGAGQ